MIDARLYAYIEGVRADHLELRAMVREIEKLLAAAQAARWATVEVQALLAAVEDLDRHLREHFAEEEAGGYMEEALAIAPRFGPQAQRLVNEHPVMLQQMAQILDMARRCVTQSQVGPELSRLLREFFTTLRAHDAAENRIIQEAFNTDLGLND
ncbi:MAG: hemerythrin domain-containing protein [Pirellulales bacterium]|nr:hemerythrin domain-containing protein [Pirellulales bacterium]